MTCDGKFTCMSMSTFYTYVSPVSIKWISIVGPLVLLKKTKHQIKSIQSIDFVEPPDEYDARFTSQRANHMQYSRLASASPMDVAIRHYLELAIMLFYPALIRLFLDPPKAAAKKKWSMPSRNLL
ncbi:hypothetical protein H0G86_011130 [Trichoderma simmonsii]|uniref:Uncharacterized protein n=1 Tax=Trichoderma simmonsii TaxID=1491479 RepID=A0A8G0PIY4_9HYPO|nr:hypothetical protein H0G86_011130 [Trichoderma simmonsii]